MYDNKKEYRIDSLPAKTLPMNSTTSERNVSVLAAAAASRVKGATTRDKGY